MKEKKKLTPPKKGPKSRSLTDAEKKRAAKNQGKKTKVKKKGVYKF